MLTVNFISSIFVLFKKQGILHCMKVIKLITSSQCGGRKKREESATTLYELYEESCLKRFRIYSPYEVERSTRDFVSDLGAELLEIIKKKMKNFKLKSEYSPEELERRLWHYFQTIAESLLDKKLLIISMEGKTEPLKERAAELLKDRYRGEVYNRFVQLLQSREEQASSGRPAFEQETFIIEESRRLTELFFSSKFSKITTYFKNHPRAIYRNYLESTLKNFMIDYTRGANVKRMRRLTLYRDDLPERLFEELKNLKGHGNLFYYVKKSDSLTIRDTNKALLVIKGFNLPGEALAHIKEIFKKSKQRAEYQRIIDNITAYIKKECLDPQCRDKLSPKNIKVLLYITDSVMKKLLKYRERDIEKAKKRLKSCVECLEIKEAVF